jgi:hypothetical protein
MKNSPNYTKVLSQAAKETTKVMTAQLRSEAIASGWDEEVANALSVKFSNNQFKVSIPARYEKQVQDLEYGTSSSQPARAIHRYSNRTGAAENHLLKVAGALLKRGKF